MATYLYLHILEGMSEQEILEDGEEQNFCLTSIKTPNILLAEYSYSWTSIGSTNIPKCVCKFKDMFLIKKQKPTDIIDMFLFNPTFLNKYQLVFAPLVPRLANKMIHYVASSKELNEGYRIIDLDVLRLFLDEHMGKKVFILES